MTWVLVDWFDLREKRLYSAHIPVVLRVVEVEVEEGEEEAPEACFGTAAAAVAAASATTAGVTELGFSRTAGEGDDDDDGGDEAPGTLRTAPWSEAILDGI